MNASAHPEGEHQAYLCLGSNIEPVENMHRAIQLLAERTGLLGLSTCWESQAVGSDGPNFLNIGALVRTSLDAAALKERVLGNIEKELGRVRGADKYAPRTMDIDIVIFDGLVLDPEIWRRAYLVLIFGEMLPELRHPVSGETLAEMANRLRAERAAVPHPEIVFEKD